MHVLITGATGQVGSRFAPRLLQRGDKVRVLVRQAERAEFLRQGGAEVVVGDLLQPETLAQAVVGIEAVIHLAAFFQGQRRKKRGASTRRVASPWPRRPSSPAPLGSTDRESLSDTLHPGAPS